ncbi:hypothetical protein [Novosphingobium sp. ZW T3_23]|uniref:hypothetical protein n=1 Tax=Novosphingobium sp. ZW T3_23 TaxID=3378084 RepID=UPI0038550591
MNVEDFEPMGSNCEFGFVLQSLGNGVPSLLRWTSIQITDLARLIDADFAECFDKEQVRPHTDDMVLDQRYQWAFHSALKSENGQFVMEPRRLEKLFGIERARLQAAIAKFRERLRGSKVICVFSADGISDEQVMELRVAIDRFSGHGDNGLVVVSSSEEWPGEWAGESELRSLSPRTWRAAVSRLAPWHQSNDADYENWTKLLTAAAAAQG